MFKKLTWDRVALIVFVMAVGGFIYWQVSTVQQLKKQLAQDEKPVQSEKPVVKEPPTAAPGKKWVPHGDHWHEVPIDAPDTWQGEPHESNVLVNQPIVLAENDISKLPKLADDIDPDDIPAFTITGSLGEVYNYNRPLTSEEREMYDTVKAKHKDGTPSVLKALAVDLVREQKIKDGALHPFLEDRYKGLITDEELNQRLDEFFERTR